MYQERRSIQDFSTWVGRKSYCIQQKGMGLPYARTNEEWEGTILKLIALLMALCDSDTNTQVESINDTQT